MLNIIIKSTLALFLSLVLYVIDAVPTNSIVSTLFTVLSIVFSITIGLLVSFDLSLIANEYLYNIIKKNIDNLFKYSLIIFLLSIPCFIACSYCIENINCLKLFIANINICKLIICLTFSILLFEIFYMSVNFIQLRKLKDDINNELRKNKM